MRRILIAGALAILAILTVVQVRLASLDSATTDEAVHLSAGYTYLTRHDFRFNPEHPPLVKTLAALPLLVIKPHILPTAEKLYNQSDNFFYDSWRENRDFGEMMMYQAGNNPDQIIFWSRLPMVLLTLILGLTIFWIALRHWGEKTAFVATALYAFNPTVNGHGHLITTDIGIALGFLLTIYSFWRLLDKPSWLNCFWLGLSFGLALLTKHTAVILLPVMFVLLLGRIFSSSRLTTNWASVVGKGLISLVIAGAVIWAGFGFHDRPLPKTDSVSTAVTLAGNQSGIELTGPSNPQPVVVANPKLDHLYSWLRPVLSLLPANYDKGLFQVIGHASSGHSSFLLGQTSKTGWWYYFPVLILTKTPLVELAAIAIGLFFVFRTKPRDSLAVTLTVAAAIYLLVSMFSKADLGIRHILPFFPLIFLATAAGLTNPTWRWPVVLGIGLICLVLTYALSFPYYLSYYNLAAGGTNNGYRIATDSNLDWGQDLKRIKLYVAAHPDRSYYVEYGWLGRSALDYYLGAGHYQTIESWQQGQTGYAIIGASSFNETPLKDKLSDCQHLTPGVFGCWLID